MQRRRRRGRQRAVESEEEMLRLIDMGRSEGGREGRFWALDPIDGTKGFLRGGQYAVCLALVVDGDVKVGLLGCPNLPVDDKAAMSADVDGGSSRRGVMFAAVKGEGATSRGLGRGRWLEEGGEGDKEEGRGEGWRRAVFV